MSAKPKFDAVSLDLETLGTDPGDTILSVGMVEFNHRTGETGEEFFISFDPTQWADLGFKQKTSTIAWWEKPELNMAREFLTQNRYNIGIGLHAVVSWLKTRNLENGLWSRGYMDETMLKLAVRIVLNIEDPWHYQAASDARTLLQAITRVGGQMADIEFIPFVGTIHHALDDARHEAKLVAAAHRFLYRMWKCYDLPT